VQAVAPLTRVRRSVQALRRPNLGVCLNLKGCASVAALLFAILPS
jgi:hypothetical protein